MGFSVRLLVIDQSDNIYRLEVARFGQMLDTPVDSLQAAGTLSL